MGRTLELASSSPETVVSSTPRVGGIIVESDKTVADGYHPFGGKPHAEKVAHENLERLPEYGMQNVYSPRTLFYNG